MTILERNYSRIHLLEPLIANQIAAGEVIERPSSVIKELLENSIDAGSDTIQIDIEKGGVQLIKITDNGCGIHKDDLQLAVRRHGTSKIHTLNDLNQIATLGFRGEALASIASVARLEINSAVKGAAYGWQLTAEGVDVLLAEKPIAHPVGTTIIVRDLFFNTPVRKKFLRSLKTEFTHLAEVVKRIAIANFSLRLQLRHEQKQIFNLLPAISTPEQEKRLQQLCGKDFIENALAVDCEATGLRLWGWVGLPHFSRNQNDLQYTYINGRMVKDKLISHALKQAYSGRSDPKSYPAFILFLELDPTLVDVNVHPTKHEVRFREGRLIHDFLFSSLAKALSSAEASYTKMTLPIDTNHYRSPYIIADNTAHYEVTKPDENKSLGKALGCFYNRFMIVERQEKLIIIDIKKSLQNLMSQQLQQSSLSQPLLFPLTLGLSQQEFDSLEKSKIYFEKIGFDLQQLGLHDIVIRYAPQAFKDVNLKMFMSSCLAELAINDKLNLNNFISTVAECAMECINKIYHLEDLSQLLHQLTQVEEIQISCRQFSLDELVKLIS